MKPRSAVLVAALCVLAPTWLRAQGDPKAPSETKPPAESKPIERATAWPVLAGDALTAARTDIERLRKAHTPEMAEQASKALIADGAGIVPDLLPVLGRERDPDALERVQDVLSKVATAEYTRLLAAEFANKSREVRIWTLRRCGQFPDPEIRAKAETAFDAALKAKPKTEEAEERAAVAEERYAAALCVTASGSLKGLDELQTWVLNEWGKRGTEMRAAFEAVRGKEATEYAGKLAFDKDRKKSVAGLNMLAGCGVKPDAILLVKPHLDSADNSVRVAAINAMRGIVDGDPPIANLPVFEAIELAKKWKSRS
jgi:hypothetical protein